jgi:hypothetical protein
MLVRRGVGSKDRSRRCAPLHFGSDGDVPLDIDAGAGALARAIALL